MSPFDEEAARRAMRTCWYCKAVFPTEQDMRKHLDDVHPRRHALSLPPLSVPTRKQ